MIYKVYLEEKELKALKELLRSETELINNSDLDKESKKETCSIYLQISERLKSPAIVNANN